jgi:hypothetical protein
MLRHQTTQNLLATENSNERFAGVVLFVAAVDNVDDPLHAESCSVRRLFVVMGWFKEKCRPRSLKEDNQTVAPIESPPRTFPASQKGESVDTQQPKALRV